VLFKCAPSAFFFSAYFHWFTHYRLASAPPLVLSFHLARCVVHRGTLFSRPSPLVFPEWRGFFLLRLSPTSPLFFPFSMFPMDFLPPPSVCRSVQNLSVEVLRPSRRPPCLSVSGPFRLLHSLTPNFTFPFPAPQSLRFHNQSHLLATPPPTFSNPPPVHLCVFVGNHLVPQYVVLFFLREPIHISAPTVFLVFKVVCLPFPGVYVLLGRPVAPLRHSFAGLELFFPLAQCSLLILQAPSTSSCLVSVG